MSWKVSEFCATGSYQQGLRVKCPRVSLDQPCFMEWKLWQWRWQLGKMEVAELKMARWALGVTRKDKIRNEYVRWTAKIAKLGDKLRNARLRWYGHVKRREGYVGKRMMEMAVSGKRGRPRRRWMDLAREDLKNVGAEEGDEMDRVKWRILSRCADPE